jgi:hypothetical protein
VQTLDSFFSDVATALKDPRLWRICTALVMLWLAAYLLFVGLASFGIWDPWELDRADEARAILDGESAPPLLGSYLVGLGFSAFGVEEWAGRLPIACFGLLTLVVLLLVVRRFSTTAAGVTAAFVAVTTPMFLVNSRAMMGEAPGYFAQLLVLASAAAAVFPTPVAEGVKRWKLLPTGRAGEMLIVIASLVVFGASLVFGVFVRGALLVLVPPLWAVVLAALFGGELRRIGASLLHIIALGAVAVATLVTTIFVVRAVIADHADFSYWLGGSPLGGVPPSFEVAIEEIFHGFAPWSALLPIAVGRVLFRPEPDPSSPRQGSDFPLRLIFALTAAFGYGAMTLYSARYGEGAYLPVPALAAMVAFLVVDAAKSRHPWFGAALLAVLFVGLLFRDFGLYPKGPIEGLAVRDLTVPEVFNPRRQWGVVLGLFAITAFLSFASSPIREESWGALPRSLIVRLMGPYRLLREQWRRGLTTQIWIAVVGVLVAVALLGGIVTWIIPPGVVPVPTIVWRYCRIVAVVLVAIPIAIALGQTAFFLFGKLRSLRFVPTLAAAGVVGFYAAQGYLPQLSSHFSPREVYDTYNELAAAGEPLGEFRVGQRAAAYYANGPIRELGDQGQLVEFLLGEGRRWAVIPADDLAQVNREYRRRAGKHLFVADARSARVVLATNMVIPDRQDQNFVAGTVLSEVPDVQHRVGANFENKIELVGYDLELPNDGFVGAGQGFVVTWYWRVIDHVPGSFTIFLHIDGHGLRLNGDHEPVEGRYPVRLWEPGDVVVDRQTLTVPQNYRPGPYTFYIGFYAGETRLQITSGGNDGENRVPAGTLLVR